MTNQNLYDLFSPYGEVISARIMVDKSTGRSRGFGFVSYNQRVSAETAIKALNGYAIANKRLKVGGRRRRLHGIDSHGAAYSCIVYDSTEAMLPPPPPHTPGDHPLC
jgi:RNA recognition motif. (a.k.a. RRM, RBD, or RNP domain)